MKLKNTLNVLGVLHEHQEHRPRTTTNHHRPPATGVSSAAPTAAPPCSGHRPRWSDPLKILSFFRDLILESRLLDTQQR
ncbi:hypothetical protein GQ457_06G014290 [Hibiscus cannabinus]